MVGSPGLRPRIPRLPGKNHCGGSCPGSCGGGCCCPCCRACLSACLQPGDNWRKFCLRHSLIRPPPGCTSPQNCAKSAPQAARHVCAAGDCAFAPELASVRMTATAKALLAMLPPTAGLGLAARDNCRPTEARAPALDASDGPAHWARSGADPHAGSPHTAAPVGRPDYRPNDHRRSDHHGPSDRDAVANTTAVGAAMKTGAAAPRGLGGNGGHEAQQRQRRNDQSLSHEFTFCGSRG
jgi:hypothetical protein